MHTTVGALILYLRDLQRQAYTTADGASWQANWHYSLFQGLSLTKHGLYAWLHSTRLWINCPQSYHHSLVTANQYSILHQCSPRHSKFLVKRPLSVLLMPFCILAIVRGCCACELPSCMYTMKYIRPRSLCIVHSCAVTSMQWDNEVYNKEVTKFMTFNWMEVM